MGLAPNATAQMRALQPEITKIRERYVDDKYKPFWSAAQALRIPISLQSP